MKKYRKMEEDLDKEFYALKENLNEVQKQSENFIAINKKRLENFNKLDEIIENIDKEFAEKTGILNKKDQTFLWTAVALQTARIYLLNKITEIEKAGKGKKEKYLKMIFFKMLLMKIIYLIDILLLLNKLSLHPVFLMMQLNFIKVKN